MITVKTFGQQAEIRIGKMDMGGWQACIDLVLFNKAVCPVVEHDGCKRQTKPVSRLTFLSVFHEDDRITPLPARITGSFALLTSSAALLITFPLAS